MKTIINTGPEQEVIVFSVYGMTGGHENMGAASLTSTIIESIQIEMQTHQREQCIIAGDLNAEPHDIPSLGSLLSDGWVDVKIQDCSETSKPSSKKNRKQKSQASSKKPSVLGIYIMILHSIRMITTYNCTIRLFCHGYGMICYGLLYNR